MQWRRILYIIAIGLVAFWFLNYSDQNQQDKTPVVSREEILDDFRNQTGEVWVNFPANFSGKSGELFYVGEQISDQPVTKVYRIYSSESGQLAYRTHDQWDNVKLPENRFETYYLVEGEWVKSRK